jgi:hypothetical protein
MNAIEILLHQFDHNLQHRWESLEAVLKDISDEEARWQAPCYAREAQEPNCPPPGTILWQLDHLSGCSRYYVEVLRQRPANEISGPPPVAPPASVSGAIEELRASHAALRAEIARLNESSLHELCGHGSGDVASFVAGCLRHEMWHAGQIALVRRLFRTRTAKA